MESEGRDASRAEMRGRLFDSGKIHAGQLPRSMVTGGDACALPSPSPSPSPSMAGAALFTFHAQTGSRRPSLSHQRANRGVTTALRWRI
jgi:hypothetical protein